MTASNLCHVRPATVRAIAILDVGEIITRRAIEEARAAEVLEVLLDSVCGRTPELEPDDPRAPFPGRDSLEVERGLADHEQFEPNGRGRSKVRPRGGAEDRTCQGSAA